MLTRMGKPLRCCYGLHDSVLRLKYGVSNPTFTNAGKRDKAVLGSRKRAATPDVLEPAEITPAIASPLADVAALLAAVASWAAPAAAASSAALSAAGVPRPDAAAASPPPPVAYQAASADAAPLPAAAAAELLLVVTAHGAEAAASEVL